MGIVKSWSTIQDKTKFSIRATLNRDAVHWPLMLTLVLPSPCPITHTETFFQPVCGFLAFGFSDFVGRSLPGLYMWPKAGSWWLPVLVVLRLVFVPLFLLCNVASRPLGITPFRHDAAFVIIMLLMGTSNGYLATLSMSYGPQ
uniref:Equilibrative nucleoside transporter 1-like n=1 Tax=Petromyzon marinus TaxID=7757 RepID=A0AAJ7TPH8_PETMA|nr:equilibrative nucleoside transporter 1-like [Petromyzon marinus]